MATGTRGQSNTLQAMTMASHPARWGTTNTTVLVGGNCLAMHWLLLMKGSYLRIAGFLG